MFGDQIFKQSLAVIIEHWCDEKLMRGLSVMRKVLGEISNESRNRWENFWLLNVASHDEIQRFWNSNNPFKLLWML